jgi:TPR repeat protein
VYQQAVARAEQGGGADRSALETLEDRYLMEVFAAAGELYAPAKLQIGGLYREGHRFVMMQSDEEAAHWFRRAGIGKMAAAQVALAECYESGRGVRQSVEEAARWYTYAATEVHPDAHAQYVVGCYYLRGHGGKPQDILRAVRFLRLAAGQGHSDALRVLDGC